MLTLGYDCPILPSALPALRQLNEQFRTAQHLYIQAPAWVRCLHCGTIHINSLHQAQVYIVQCSSCSLRNKGEAYEQGLRTAHTLNQLLRTQGIENLTREQMLTFNALATQVCSNHPNTAAHCKFLDAEDGCSGRNFYKELLNSTAYAELTATIIKLRDAQDALESLLAVQPKQVSQAKQAKQAKQQKQPTIEDM